MADLAYEIVRFLSETSERCLDSIRFLLLPTFDYLTLSAKEYRKA